MRLAIGMGAWLLGKKLKLDPQALLAEGLQKLAQNPEIAKLTDELRGQLLMAARTAATKGLSDQVSTIAESLNRQAELARQAPEQVENKAAEAGVLEDSEDERTNKSS